MKVKTKSYDVGIIVGRFQVAELHSAHKDLIESVMNNHPRTVIILGVNKVPGTRNNPLDYAARKQMIQEVYPDIDVLYIEDCKSNEVWSKRLDAIIRVISGPNHSAALYGSRDSFISSYTTKSFPVFELESETKISGSEIRNALSKKSKPSYDWRAGAIWQTFNQYKKVCTTVDIAIVKNDQVLLGKKPDEKFWRFPGGFSEDSSSFESDASREIKEETGILVESLKYIGSFKIDDWRYRNEVDCIKTIFFIGTCDNADQIKAADDISYIKWVKLSELRLESIEPEHKILVEALLNYINNQ